DQEGSNARRETASPLVALRVGEVDRVGGGLRLLVLLLEVLRRRGRVKLRFRTLADRPLHRGAGRARADRLRRLRRVALAARGRGRGRRWLFGLCRGGVGGPRRPLERQGR